MKLEGAHFSSGLFCLKEKNSYKKFRLIAINKFLKSNNLLSVIRAHEAQIEGYIHYIKKFLLISLYFQVIKCIVGVEILSFHQ